jgi:hypothetical protein
MFVSINRFLEVDILRYPSMKIANKNVVILIHFKKLINKDSQIKMPPL